MSTFEQFSVSLSSLPSSAKELSFVQVLPANFVMGTVAKTESRAFDDFKDAPFETELTSVYWISRFPITQAQWLAIFPSNPSYFRGADLPVDSVTWHEARFFCKQLTGLLSNSLPEGAWIDLPTEAQWEFACASGCRERLPEEHYLQNLLHQAWFEKNSSGTTHAVGTKLPNPFGLYDMLGNVLEWCRDGAEDYPGVFVSNWQGANDFNKVVRGGCWATEFPSELLTPFGRGYMESGNGTIFCGFRVVIQLP